MRESTSANQAQGSILHRLHDAIKLRSTAAVLPPLSLPKKVQFRGPPQYPGWPARWRRYRSPIRRLRGSASAPPTDSGHSAPPRRMGFSAEPAVVIDKDIYAVSATAAPKRVAARRTSARQKAPALWRAPPPHTGVRSDAKRALYSADLIPAL